MSFHYKWGLPGIDVPVPPICGGVGPLRVPLAWDRLRFGSLSLFDLRRRLGVHRTEPGIFQQYRNRFLTADIAWFAGGASTDGAHRSVGFFPEFVTMRNTLPTGPMGNEARKLLNERMQYAVFDLATLWDRAFGGTTMVMHVDGTTIPGMPAAPQYLHAAIYLPPTFLATNRHSHPAIATIVQTFLESVGVPTVRQWKENAHARGGTSPNPTSTTLIPTPARGSAHYRFLGRPEGELNKILNSFPAPPHSIPVLVIPDDDEDQFNGDLVDAIERAYAEVESAEHLE
ncbi:hypothetical protein B0H13DRAFT_1934048 [Mycena leptocephala]|nr:hypothetical protein B0H13DRAFT_1934048 [Mycena leptocephala]